MELGLNLQWFSNQLGLERAAKIAHEAGFRYLDFTGYASEESKLADTLKVLEKYDLEVIQTHAPFNRYGSFPGVAEHKHAVDICLENTKWLGAKYMVVHGDEFDFANMEYDAQTAMEYNYDYFAPYVEKAEKYGFKVAFENVFEENPKKPRHCSKAEDLLDLVERFRSPAVCVCWDFGHGSVASREKTCEDIALVSKYIECTHLHDNDKHHDLHQIPFMGKMDWRPVMEAFRKSPCQNLTYELVYGSVHDKTAEPLMKLLWETGQTLLEL